jgi:hypothetical protein
MGHIDPRDVMIGGCLGSFGCTKSMKGHDGLFGCDGFRRGTTHPKDMTIHNGDPWSPYKRTRCTTKSTRK